MSATVQPAHPSSAWRALVIGSVAVLAVGIGVAAGSFLLTARAGAGLGPGAAYVPADAPYYVEFAVEPSEAQDAALRELLGHFPAIDGLDLDRPLHEQLVELLEESIPPLRPPFSYADDIEPWLGGTVAVAVPHLDPEAFTDPMAVPEMPDWLVVASVSDPLVARSTAERLIDEAAEMGREATAEEHRGTSIVSFADATGAMAITDDALLFAQDADAVRRALDVAASGASLASDASWAPLTSKLPADRLLFAVVDMTELVEASLRSSAELSGLEADAFAALLEGQSMRGAFAVSAHGDLLAMDAAGDAPTGRYEVTNADRGLADEVPADAIFFSGGNLGGSLTAFVEVVKEAAASDPSAGGDIDALESAIGAELEDFVSWIGDGAIVAGWDGSQPYAGFVIVPTDVEAASDRLEQLAGFARLGNLDPSAGLTVEEADVAGVTVTTIRWQDAAGSGEFVDVVPPGIAVEFAVTDDRALIGIGDRFVDRVLELDVVDSLASDARFADAVDAFGGPNNAGIGWLDLRGLREALEASLLPLAEEFEMTGYDEVLPWLEPLDRLVFVSRLEGDVVVQRGGLLLD